MLIRVLFVENYPRRQKSTPFQPRERKIVYHPNLYICAGIKWKYKFLTVGRVSHMVLLIETEWRIYAPVN